MLLAGYAWKKRTATGAVSLVLFMLTVSEWLLAHTIELSAPSIEDKMFWNGGRWFVLALLFSNKLLFLGGSDPLFLRIGKT